MSGAQVALCPYPSRTPAHADDFSPGNYAAPYTVRGVGHNAMTPPFQQRQIGGLRQTLTASERSRRNTPFSFWTCKRSGYRWIYFPLCRSKEARNGVGRRYRPGLNPRCHRGDHAMQSRPPKWQGLFALPNRCTCGTYPVYRSTGYEVADG